jgi:HlyD family secretion protein
MAFPTINDLLRNSRFCGWRTTGRVLIGIAVVGVVGCDSGIVDFFDKQPVANLAPVAAAPPHIVAQGQLEPERGVLAVMAPPGDRVAKIAVVEGDPVSPGDLLVELESLRAKNIELDVAQTKLAEGRDQIEAEKAAANARLQVAQSKLKQAETQLRQSRSKLQVAESSGGSLDLLRRAAELGDRKLDRLRSATEDPSTMRLVSDNKLEEESLRISETRAQYEIARRDANDAIESAELAVLAAKQEIVAAEKSIAAAEASGSLASLEKQIELLQLNIETAHLTSPTSGRILSVNAMVGQATTTMPLMHLADTSKMICVAEVNVADLGTVRIGQEAEIHSPGLARTLRGTVTRVQQMVTMPTMPSPFPMEPVDRHTAEVNIAISPEDTEAAAARIRMQVNVKIFTDGVDDNGANGSSPANETTPSATSP